MPSVNYIVHLRICTRSSLLSILQVMKNWEGGGNESFGHKSTPSHRPWTEAYYTNFLASTKMGRP